MLQDFITSALVIDDKVEEVKDLISHLEEKDIWVRHYTPDQIENKNEPFNNRKIIFLDLYLDTGTSTDNIAKIRRYFKTIIGENFGTYGIVLWTKHTSHFDDFCDKIYNKNNNFTLPLFVISLDKTEYIKKGSYDGILDGLEEKLEKDIPSSFFIEWNKAVKRGSDNTITTLYNLFQTNEKKNKHLEPTLYKLACNYTGIPEGSINGYNLQKDLVKSLMDTLQFEVSNEFNNIDGLFSDTKRHTYSGTPEEKIIVFSKLNSQLLLDFHNLSEDVVIPGSIYEVFAQTSPLYITEILFKKKIENLDSGEDFKNLKKRRICIEVTPPCDFAQNKKQSLSRIVGGVQMDYSKEVASNLKADSFYSFLYPVHIDGFENPQMIIFDFYKFQTISENELKEKSKFKIIMRTKDKLFADIIQKFSSHSARLGIAILYP